MAPKIGSSPAPAPGVFVPNPPPPPMPAKPPPPPPKPAPVDSFVSTKLPQKSIAMTPGPSGVNTTNTVRPSASGAISKKEWDNPQLLLAKLTQNPAGGGTANSAVRCGPSNLLGGALMAGPEHAARYLSNVANAPENNRLTAAEKQELKAIAEKVKNKTATFEELGRAQDLTYKSGNRVTDVDQAINDALTAPASLNLTSFERQELSNLANKQTWTPADTARIGELVSKASGSPSRVVADPAKPGTYLMTVEGNRSNTDTSGLSDKEIDDLAKMGGLQHQSVQMGDSETVKSLFKGLKPGETAVIRVSGTPDGNNPDHFVTVGRREDGTAFIYNPDPAKGDSTLFVGSKGANQSADFMKQLQRYEDRVGFDPNGKLPKYTKVG